MLPSALLSNTVKLVLLGMLLLAFSTPLQHWTACLASLDLEDGQNLGAGLGHEWIERLFCKIICVCVYHVVQYVV